MSDFFTQAALIATVASGIRLAVPLLIASLGEMYGQRSGVLNLGVDGVMLLGAFGGYYAVLQSGNVWLGLLVGVLIGLAFGVITAVMSVTLKAEQGISGIGVYLFGLGFSDLLFQRWVGTPLPIPSFPKLNIPGLSDIPILGEMLFRHTIVVYLAFAAVPLSIFIINHTTFGMKIRAVGENPEAADSLGVSVSRVRYVTVTLGGILSGVAGASMSIATLNVFQQNMTSGLGFIAVALVYFGGWRPVGVMLGALLFSMVNALQLRLQVEGARIPSEVLVMMPYILTIVALVLTVQRVRSPSALAKPFDRQG